MHSSLPGLTRLEQMFLVALADTVATTSAEVPSSTDQQYTGKFNRAKSISMQYHVLYMSFHMQSKNI